MKPPIPCGSRWFLRQVGLTDNVRLPPGGARRFNVQTKVGKSHRLYHSFVVYSLLTPKGSSGNIPTTLAKETVKNVLFCLINIHNNVIISNGSTFLLSSHNLPLTFSPPPSRVVRHTRQTAIDAIRFNLQPLFQRHVSSFFRFVPHF